MGLWKDDFFLSIMCCKLQWVWAIRKDHELDFFTIEVLWKDQSQIYSLQVHCKLMGKTPFSKNYASRIVDLHPLPKHTINVGILKKLEGSLQLQKRCPRKTCFSMDFFLMTTIPLEVVDSIHAVSSSKTTLSWLIFRFHTLITGAPNQFVESSRNRNMMRTRLGAFSGIAGGKNGKIGEDLGGVFCSFGKLHCWWKKSSGLLGCTKPCK